MSDVCELGICARYWGPRYCLANVLCAHTVFSVPLTSLAARPPQASDA